MEEEKKDNKGLKVVLILFLLLCLVGTCLFIYKRTYKKTFEENSNDENMTEGEVIALGKNVYNDLYEFLNNLPSSSKYSLMDNYKQYNENELNKKLTDDGLLYNDLYYYVNNFETSFYSIFSKNVKISDIFVNDDKHYEHYPYRHIVVDNKYYIDSMCRASGQTLRIDDWKIINRDNNIIDYSIKTSGIYSSCSENCEYQKNNEMQLIKEEGNWKINKIFDISPCDILEKES